MKKIIAFGLTLCIVLIFSLSVQADESPTWDKIFSDDFEEYQTGKVENQDSFKSVWTNDGWSGTNQNPTDINDVATIQVEDNNQFVNMDYDSSFFYMSPTNFRANEFEVEFDFRSHDLKDAWVGINMRKEYRDIRYNGGTGLMVYFRTKYIKNSEDQIVGEALVVHALRGGSLSTTDLDDLLVGDRVIEYIYPESEPIDPTEQIQSRWFNVRVHVENTANSNEALYQIYVDDVLLASLTYARASLNIAGYFGLHACTGDIDVDNLYIESFDEVAPPPIIRVNRLVNTVGTVGEEFAFPGGEENDIELIDDADQKVLIEVIQPNSEVIVIADSTYVFTPTQAGIHTLRYTAENAFGEEGTVEFLINVQEAEDPEEPEEPEEPIEPEEPQDPEEPSKNNTILWIALSIVGVSLIGFGTYIFVIKKK